MALEELVPAFYLFKLFFNDMRYLHFWDFLFFLFLSPTTKNLNWCPLSRYYTIYNHFLTSLGVLMQWVLLILFSINNID